MSAARSHGRKRKGHPEPLGEALGKLAKALGAERQFDEYGIMAAWPEVVGERIAQVTTPQHIENGVLFISVSTAPWRAELALQRQEIMRRLNTAAGKDVVREIRFR